MNEQLSQEFQAREVQQAIKQMAPLKALAPNGMPPLFFQHYWNLIGDDVIDSVLTFLNSASLPKHLNDAFITLILKKKTPNLQLILGLLVFVMFYIRFFRKS